MTRLSKTLVCLLMLAGFANSPALADSRIWFDNTNCPRSLTKEGADQAFNLVRGWLAAGEMPAPPEPGDVAPCVLFLSLGDQQAAATTTIGFGMGLTAALLDATRKQAARANPQQLSMRVDLVHRLIDQGESKPEGLLTSLWGVASDYESRIALLSAELVAYQLTFANGYLRPSRMIPFLETHPSRHRLPENSDLRTSLSQLDWKYRFSTHAWFSDGKTTFPLYRGHRTHYSLDREAILRASVNGGDYLLRSIGSNGRYVYTWIPGIYTATNSYNILRHAGASYSLLELYRFRENSQLPQSVERAIEYLAEQIHPCPGHPELRCVVENSEIKLGGNGLAILAMVEHARASGQDTWLPTARQLAGWLALNQAESGAFTAFKWSWPSGEPDPDYVMEFYPGEAIFGLARLYQVDPDPLWLETARRNALYQINVRDAGIEGKDLRHDHWLLYGLAELYRSDPNAQYLEHGMRLTDAIVQAQNRNPQFPDWLGSYNKPPASTPTATRGEALGAAWRLATAAGAVDRLPAIFSAACLGARFLLQNQFRSETAMFLSDPPRALGGVHASMENDEIRIDYIQHSLSALLGLLEMIDSEFAHKAGLQCQAVRAQ